jgi:hypothetical protein
VSLVGSGRLSVSVFVEYQSPRGMPARVAAMGEYRERIWLLTERARDELSDIEGDRLRLALMRKRNEGAGHLTRHSLTNASSNVKALQRKLPRRKAVSWNGAQNDPNIRPERSRDS